MYLETYYFFAIIGSSTQKTEIQTFYVKHFILIDFSYTKSVQNISYIQSKNNLSKNCKKFIS